MIYQVEITEQADSDLRGIYEYIAFNLLEQEIAAKQLGRLEESITKLAEMPAKYKLCEKEPWRGRGVHQMSVDHFLVFYLVQEEEKIVTVLRIVYSGRDMDVQLKKTMI